MRPELLIRRMEGEDEARICTDAMVNSEPWLTLRYTHEMTYKVITDTSREPYVAVSGPEIAAFIVVNLVGPLRGYIQTICVLPAWRGEGVGRQLLTFAEKRIFRDYPNVFLFVSSFNDAAQKFYASLGYQKVGEVPEYVVKGHSEYLMRKTIGPLADFSSKA